MKRRDTLALVSSSAFAWSVRPAAAQPPAAMKVLHAVFPVAETGFDPPLLNDIYSLTVSAHIFEAAYEFDHLARPVKLRPRLAVGMPEHSADYKVWTVRLKPGIYFADDEAFKGHKREMTAHDFIYMWKRYADPANKSASWPNVEDFGFVGLAALRAKGLAEKKPFDYDADIPGLRALDRYTIQYTLEHSRPRFAESLGNGARFGAMAREVVEHYGDRINEHPVGTGPFRLGAWRRSSQIVLDRNPNFREAFWDAEPAADDAEGQAMLARLKGRRLPLIDRVEIAVIEEAQPRWLSFVNGQLDYLAVPQEFVPVAIPGGKLAPNLAKKGIQSWRVLIPFTQLIYFNMQDPVAGGNQPARVALRRAVWLGLDVDKILRLAFRGQGIQAQSIIAPYTTGYRADFKSENSEFSPARAKALLDLYGYVDRDGDGWRKQPDGSPLLLECASQPEGLSRQIDDLMKKSMDAIGIRVQFRPAKWPENLKAARAGKLMMWRVGTSAEQTDGQDVLRRLYTPEIGQGNLARFSLPAFDALFDRLTDLPDGPEREAVFDEAKRLAVAYAPYKVLLHQYADMVAQPWIDGYRRPIFWLDLWHKLDIDLARQARKA